MDDWKEKRKDARPRGAPASTVRAPRQRADFTTLWRGVDQAIMMPSSTFVHVPGRF
jgi:hypothetical protein